MIRSNRQRLAVLCLALALTLVPVWIMAESMFSGGPPDGRTGAPGESTCTACHSGAPDDGSVEISGIPSYYIPGQTYTITVNLDDPGQSRWGFELTAIDALGDGAGDFTITDFANTQLSDNGAPGRDYVKHTNSGTYSGTPDGPVSWEFDWTAPSVAVGDITFYAAGNAANNNGSTSGDNIYTTSSLMTELPMPAIPSMTDVGLILLVVMLLVSAFFLMRSRAARQAG